MSFRWTRTLNGYAMLDLHRQSIKILSSTPPVRLYLLSMFNKAKRL